MNPGLYPKMPMAEYLDLQAFSSGLAQTLLAQSPLHAWVESPWNPEREREDSSTADIGTFAHAMLLEGGTDALVICPFDDWRKNDAKAMRDNARAAGKLPILQHKVSEVEAMVEAAKAFIAESEIAPIFFVGAAEQTVIWKEGDVLCKARPDWLNPQQQVCLSYKTTAGSAQPDAWIRTQLPGYDMGMVLYERGVKAACGVPECRVIALVQEQKAPFSCSLVGLAPAWRNMADNNLNVALATWEACLKSGKFPAYPTRICWAEPKPWMLAEAEEQELEGAIADPAVLWEKP